jgi:hypothetical protein
MERVTRRIVSSCLKANPTFRKKPMPKDVLDKKLFIEIIETLRQIEDRRWFAVEEIGVDLSMYEESYFLVIENLLKMHYSKEQIALINYYVYQIPILEGFDGTVDLTDGKDTITVKMETPEHLWNAVVILKKNLKK